MIPFSFDYYLPDTWQEAVDIYHTVQAEGKNALYYGGGTEIISMARVGSIQPDAVIDIKRIAECLCLGTDGTQLVFGAALTLTTIRECGLYPLLSLAAGRIADHTVQCKLTLGGNLAGTIHYHETLLTLLLADAVLLVANAQSIRQLPVRETLDRGRRLDAGELILSVSVDKSCTAYPFAHIKKTKSEKIGYPLVSMAALDADGVLRLGASALCSYPFRFADMPMDGGRAPEDMVRELEAGLPEAVLSDLEGSADYRRFIFAKTAKKIIMEFEQGGGNGDA